jgi:hypothetical protein
VRVPETSTTGDGLDGATETATGVASAVPLPVAAREKV